MVMHVELQATCSALGYQEGQKYVKEPDCLETVKDLIRFLKREDETCDIRQQLGHAQILQNDLIPLVKYYKKDRSLMECVIRLMVNLTQPGILCFNNQIPEEKTGRNHYLEVESHLQTYKEAFVDEELFAVLTEKMGDMLKLDWERRQEDDKMFIERLLILVRNILHVPPNTQEEKRTDDDASVHDQVLWALHVSGMEDLLLYIASSDEERMYSVHVLEIISLMFREQTPELLAHAGVQRSMTEKEKDQRELELAREKERAKKLAAVMKQSSRHSRFGGTFVLKNMKSISDRDIIYHKSVGDADSVSLGQNKKPKKQPRNRQAIKDVELVRRSTLSIRLALKDFCVQFLESCYNPLMKAVKDCLMREKSQDHDETYYLWAMRFFMEFCRVHSGKVELVSETMSVPSFHYIYNNLITYYEMIMTEKKEGKIWARRVHLALKAYQELLLTLYSMDKSRDSQIRESSKVIKSNVFYMMEFRDIFITLLRKFDESKQSRSYLKDLVETTHLFLKMLEAMCKHTAHMVVQKKKRKLARKPGKRKEKTKSDSAEPDPELEDLWDDVSSELSALIQGRAELPTDVTPFDAASEVEVDQQRVDAMIRIQQCMRNRQAGQALALFRSAREVWPDRDEFGRVDISPENEFMALREVFFSNISAGVPVEETPLDPLEEQEEEIQEEEEPEMTASEQEFNYKDYLGRYAKPQILKAHVTLLEDFEKNSSHTNHCAIKMLHRVAVELDLMGMLFQASLFRVFQKLLFSAVAKSTHYQEFVKFAVHVVRHFVAAAQKNDKIFLELLFWKNSKEAVDIVHGYGSSESNVKQRWTEDQEQELQRLFEEYRDVDDGRDAVDHIMDDITDREKTRGQIVRQLKKQGLIESVKDLKSAGSGMAWREEEQMELEELWEKHRDVEDGRDSVDHIMDDITDKAKTRGQIIRQLKKQGLIESAKDLKRKMPGARSGVWTEGNVLELRDLFDTYRHSDDPVGNVVANLEVKRSKAKVMEKILELGLVEDRKELYKKRGGGRRRADSGGQSDDEGEAFWEDGAFMETNQTTAVSGDEGSGAENSDEPADSTSQSVETMLNNLIENGLRGAVEWIQRGLRRTAEDRSSSASPQPVPIVPLTEDCEDAMEDNLFTDFLKRIGLSPPANEQETFWRIPAGLTVEDLRTISDGLQLDEENNFTEMESLKRFVENRPQPIREKKKNVEKPTKKRPPKVTTSKAKKDENKTKRNSKKPKPKDDFIDSNSELSESEQEERVSKKTKKTRSERSHGADRDSDTSDDEPLVSSVKGRNSSQAKSRLKRPLQSDSEDSDNMNLQIDLSDDDAVTAEPARKRSRLAVLDDSDDDSRPSQNPDGPSEPSQLSTNPTDIAGGKTDKNPAKQRKRKQMLDSDDSSRDSTMSTSTVDSQKSKRQRKSKAGNSDSAKMTNKKITKKSKKSTVNSDNSEDELPLSLSTKQQKPNKASAKAVVSDDSEEDTPFSVSTSQKSKKGNSKDDSEEDTPLSVSTSEKSKKANSRTVVSDDSDEDMSNSTNQTKARAANRRAVVSDDSDEDTPLVPLSNQTEASQGSQKPVGSDESDDDTPLVFSQQSEDGTQKKATLDTFPATMLSVPLDSDSDDDHIPLNQALKGAGVRREGTE